MKEKWFETWFDSAYYHKLYANRDFTEAEAFISNLLDYLKPAPNAKVLDLGCGKGRHSIFLSEKDLIVTGVDLSKNSIDSLIVNNSDRIHFERWDMREPYKKSYFDYVFNLFTSFGYFEKNMENLAVLHSIHYNLKNQGILVLDFFNECVVKNTLVKNEIIHRGSLDFSISRKIEKGFVIKGIQFSDQGEDYRFEERVQLICYDTFISLFDKSGFEIMDVFGDYQLRPYNKDNSPRLIFIVKKIDMVDS